jgi:hypothetical protein
MYKSPSTEMVTGFFKPGMTKSPIVKVGEPKKAGIAPKKKFVAPPVVRRTGLPVAPVKPFGTKVVTRKPAI